MNLDEYRAELIEDIKVSAASEDTNERSKFVDTVVDILESAEEFDDFTEGYFEGIGERGRKMIMDGYYFDPYDKSCLILVSDFSGDAEATNLTSTEINKMYDSMRYLIEASINGYILNSGFEESSIGYGLAKDIFDNLNDIVKFKFYIVTDRKLSDRVKNIKKEPINGKIVELNVWDIKRLYDIYSSTLGKESIEIDLSTMGGIPCVKAVDNDEYDAYLAIIPGDVLANMYIEYGSRLLEGNVRSFLSIKGKVNKGIRNTILNEPNMFFAYNNGIAATSTEIETQNNSKGLVITKIKDLQIINGGQTTASIANAVLQDKQNVSKISVPMKLSIVDHEKAQEMIPTISRCANSQNKVDEADFFSNHPYHIRLEEYSRKIIAPAKGGDQFGTIWFYERARGQYTQAQMKLTKSERVKFQTKNPKNQLIKKVDLSKYINTFECLPHIVSKGAQSSMRYFAEKIDKDWEKSNTQFNDYYYKKIISYAIIFKDLDKMIADQDWYKEIKAYKANIVTYTIAVTINQIKKKYPNMGIDYKKIWNTQKMYPSLAKQLLKTARAMLNFITLDDRPILNVTEWCKKEACWDRAKSLDWPLEQDFVDDLVDLDFEKQDEVAAKKDRKVDNELNSEIAVINYGDDYWKKVIQWADGKRLLTPMESDLLSLASRAVASGRIPSSKQAAIILQTREKLIEEGMPKEF
ncbi:MAG: AIPR family protein [Bacilli bacterium]|nr:AIPR family protein [Bacilli bacterium]